MSILSDFEGRLSRAIEGVFAGAFRSPVEPVEIAKALAREMDDGRIVGIGKIYAPVTFHVSLSADDRRNLGDFLEVLAGELSTYLTDHARQHSYHLVSRPKIRFETDTSLRIGRFHVLADLAPTSETSVPPGRETFELATVTVGETHHDVTLTGRRVVVGRLADCEIPLEDANASRQHAAFVLDDDGWHIEDLGSTNGTRVNGTLVSKVRLSDGDIVTIGATRLVFHDRRG